MTVIVRYPLDCMIAETKQQEYIIRYRDTHQRPSPRLQVFLRVQAMIRQNTTNTDFLH